MPDFAKLLDLTGPKSLAVCIACVLIKIANAYGFLSLSEIHSSAIAVTDVTAIVSGALALMWIVELSVHGMRRAASRRRLSAQIRDYLSSLGPDEEDFLRTMLANNQQSTNKRIDDPVVTRLVQKGLLRQAGSGSILAFPYTVPPLVWKEMQMHWPQEWIEGAVESQSRRFE